MKTLLPRHVRCLQHGPSLTRRKECYDKIYHSARSSWFDYLIRVGWKKNKAMKEAHRRGIQTAVAKHLLEDIDIWDKREGFLAMASEISRVRVNLSQESSIKRKEG
ncbi:MAG: hypothetical protein ABSE81_02645 [Candidatus Omnitrophota bacterium]|jgi:hypothetical protein